MEESPGIQKEGLIWNPELTTMVLGRNMSRRLTPDDKSRIMEQVSDDLIDYLIGYTNRFIDANDSSEFNEGMAAGLLLAVEIISKDNNSKITPTISLSLMAAIAGYIRAASAEN